MAPDPFPGLSMLHAEKWETFHCAHWTWAGSGSGDEAMHSISSCFTFSVIHLACSWIIFPPSPADLCYWFHVDYIDEVFGDQSLWSSKPNTKAQSRIFVTDFGDKVSNRLYHLSNCGITLSICAECKVLSALLLLLWAQTLTGCWDLGIL